MKTILTLNSGQHILFGFALTLLQGRTKRTFTSEQTMRLAQLVIELTAQEFYDNVFETPDVLLMSVPERAYEIFDEWFEENEIYFEHFYLVSNP